MSQIVKKTLKSFKGKVYDISTPSGNFQLENGQVVSNSAGGSLLSYCLGITQIDPLKYDLLFERFLTRGATSYPDIDVDFTDNFALKQKLAQLWGEESVIAISNINTLKFRSLIKDVSKFFGVPFDEVNAITKIMLDEAIPKAKAKHQITAGVYDPTYEELIEFSPSLQQFLKKYPDVAENIKTLQGQIKAISRHASGVLVSDNLFSKMPVISSSGVRQTPWGEGQTVRHLEPLGFIKFDILGLTTLQIIRGAITRVLRLEMGREPTLQEVSKFYDERLHPDRIDLKDQKVFENVFQQGNWAATFQFAEKGAQEFCMKVKPKSIEEITAITSIYRPGAMSSGVHHDYVSAKANPENIKYLHPILKELLEKNYGFILYQEDLANIAHKLGKDISLEEGNLLRKLLIKKGLGEVGGKKQVIHDKFLQGCLEKGIAEEDAEDLWEKMSAFSTYSFNRTVHFEEMVSTYTKEGNFLCDKKIIDVKSGDFVRSRNEKNKKDIFTKVVKNHYHGKLPLVKITLNDGKTIKCTMNHKFRTTCGQMLPLKTIIERQLSIFVSAGKK